MFKAINDRINVSFVSNVEKGADDIVNLLKDNSGSQKWYSLLLGAQIDYKEFKFNEQEIEILRHPNTFSPSRPFGKIKLTLLEQSPKETKVKCDIMPWNNAAPALIAIQTVWILLWLVLFMALSGKLEMSTKIGISIAALIVFNGISILKIRSDKRNLIDYSKTIIKMIKE